MSRHILWPKTKIKLINILNPFHLSYYYYFLYRLVFFTCGLLCNECFGIRTGGDINNRTDSLITSFRS